MEATIDVSDEFRTDRRDRVFDRLDEAAPGDTVVVTADEDVEPTLRQYHITRATTLEWATERQEPDVWEVRVTKHEAPSDATVPEFDVRELPPRRRHAVLTETFDLLEPGDGFVLVNDHDPKPLYHELRSTHGDVVGWEYASRDAGEWRVEIRKTGESAVDSAGTVAATFDVREIPKEDRHPTIHHRYGNLEAGDSIAVIAPHEPRPLHREFQQRYGTTFDWEVQDRDADRCRVHITKAPEQKDPRGDDGEDGLEVTTELDVRDRPPAERHERIFEAYAALDAGEGFVLVNDHDPKPLYHQFDAEAGPAFRWEYRVREPGEFRVLIGKADTGDPTSTADSSMGSTETSGPRAPF